MSYDLMVFDPKAAPTSQDAFMRWYNDQTTWREGHSYDDPAITTPDLKAWFFDIIKNFPAMNGPDARHDAENPKVTDYSIGRSVIYAAFAGSQSELAYHTMFALAKARGVGFFEASEADGGVWMPDASGDYVCVFRYGG